MRREYWIATLLALLTLGVYWPVTHAGFINYDDPSYVTANLQVKAGLTRDGVAWAFTTSHGGNWHPLTWISHMADCQWFGVHAGRHHLVNVLFHTANALLLFALLRILTGAIWRSAIVAALFAWHPLHVESVAWISERKDVLSTFFWFLTLLAYTAYVRCPKQLSARRRIWYGLALAGYALGLLAKQMLVTLPFVLLLLDYWPLARANRPGAKAVEPETDAPPAESWPRLALEKLPFFALTAMLCFVTYRVQAHGGSMVALGNLSLAHRAGNALTAYIIYIRKTFWPVDLAIFYPLRPLSSIWPAVAAAAALAGITAGVLRLGGTRRYLPVGWFWFLGTLVPVIGIVQVGAQALADRYSYVPLIGMFVMVVWGLGDLAESPAWARRGAGLLAAGTLGACLVCTSHQAQMWGDVPALCRHSLAITGEDNLTIQGMLGTALNQAGRYDETIKHFEPLVAKLPAYADGHAKLGYAYLKTGRLEEAMTQFQAAVELEPTSAVAQDDFGFGLLQMGRIDEAAEHLQKAVELGPDYGEAHNNLGYVEALRGQPEAAEREFRKALQQDPDSPEARKNLGNVLVRLGRWDEGISQLRQVLSLQPGLTKERMSLAAALLNARRPEEALAELQKVLELQPGSADAHNNLGLLLMHLGRTNEGIAQLRTAAELTPGDPGTQNNLGMALVNAGKLDEALVHLAQAAQSGPPNPTVENNYGDALLRSGRLDESILHFDRALELRPNFADAARNLGLALLKSGHAEAAAACFQRVLGAAPGDERARDGLAESAWRLATDPVDARRGGARALELAQQADQLAAGTRPEYAAVLAAACAETGRFPEAISNIQRAIRLSGTNTQSTSATEYARELESYQRGQPLRVDPGAGESAVPHL